MKKILKNKAGVTILEGVIALGLLALVMAGAFGVLLSTSRQTMQPDFYEEMSLAGEKASDVLKEYITVNKIGGEDLDNLESKVQPHRGGGSDAELNYQLGPCGADSYDLKCLLPPICNESGSEFRYQLTNNADFDYWPTNEDGIAWEGRGNPQMYSAGSSGTFAMQRDSTQYTGNPAVAVQLYVKCNGYQL